LAGLGQGLDEIVPVHVIQKDVLTMVATAHDVINCARVLDTEFARHGGSIAINHNNTSQGQGYGVFCGLTRMAVN
jgi:hypothetical protein